MSEDVRVSVVEFSDRPYFLLQWRDPATRLRKTKSSKIRRTGLKRDRARAEKAAGELEAALREGRYQTPSRITWADFRHRHEEEVQRSLATETCRKFSTTFDLVERILRPRRLRDVTAAEVSRWIAKLQDEGRADTTVGLYCRELRAALNWAAEMGFIRQAPKIRIPRGAKEGKPKSRPIVLEEHERMLAAVGKVVRGPQVAAWQQFLDGLLVVWAPALRGSGALLGAHSGRLGRPPTRLPSGPALSGPRPQGATGGGGAGRARIRRTLGGNP